MQYISVVENVKCYYFCIALQDPLDKNQTALQLALADIVATWGQHNNLQILLYKAGVLKMLAKVYRLIYLGKMKQKVHLFGV